MIPSASSFNILNYLFTSSTRSGVKYIQAGSLGEVRCGGVKRRKLMTGRWGGGDDAILECIASFNVPII
jgi:hypothetical protein